MPHVPRPQRGAAVKNGFFRKDEFRYDAKQNAYICPAGQALTPIREGKLRALKKVDYRTVPKWPLGKRRMRPAAVAGQDAAKRAIPVMEGYEDRFFGGW
jgi:hypothetical protein